MIKLKTLTGTFEVTATIDSYFVLENKADIIKNVSKQITEQGGKVYIEKNNIHIENSGQFFRLPTLNKVRTGKITFRSKDFIFEYTDSEGVEHKSYCDKPKATDLIENGFTTTNFRGEKTTWQLG